MVDTVPATATTPTATTSPPSLPGFLLGVGFGGFIDGIVLHQILQWHHMLTATGDHPADTVRGLEQNTLADGLFHVASWLFVLAGATLMLRAWQQRRLAPPWRLQVGLLLAGWATFNLVEGVVDHHLLGVHNVRDDVADPQLWNVGFLVVSAVLLVVGLVLVAQGRRRVADARRAARDEVVEPGQ
jgi:uncharacterized membrane protein